MKVTPLKQYNDPAFPTHAILEEHPELLRIVPGRWQRNPVVLTALAAVAALVSAEGSSAAAEDQPPTSVERVWVKPGDYVASAHPGYVISLPVVALSEEEARRVICDEAKKAGLVFKADSKSIEVPKSRLVQQPPAAGGSQEELVKFQLDGTDAKHNVSFEYLSEWDLHYWRKSTANTDSFSGTSRGAEVLNSALSEAQPKGYYRVFCAGYAPQSMLAPVVFCDRNGRIDKKAAKAAEKAAQQASVNEARAQAREELRQQVRDFISWLKTQGVI